MTSKSLHHSKSQQRILRVLLMLAGHEVNGVAPGELAKGLKVDPAAITRDMDNLIIAGLGERIPETGRYRLTPKLCQIGLAMLSNIDRAQAKISEIKQRYTRIPT